jgi:tetratricopeptide (TPR) repeat protein
MTMTTPSLRTSASIRTRVVAAAQALCLTAVLSHVAHAQLAGTARWADSLSRSVERAYRAGDERALKEAAALADRVLAIAPGDPLVLHYKGYALYRVGTVLLGRRANEEAEATLKAADEALEASAEKLPWPETWALRSAVQGQIIAASGGGAMISMRYGMKSGAMMEKALALGGNNPRVWVLKGSGEIFKPELFGGGLDAAAASLERAQNLMAQDRPEAPRPAWGALDLHLWQGQVAAARGRPDEARAHYQQVLAIAPGFPWVTRELLPALDRPRTP